MRRKVMGLAVGLFVALTGFTVAIIGSGVAAVAETTGTTTTGTSGTTVTTVTTTGSTTTGTTTTAPATTVTVTVTVTQPGTTVTNTVSQKVLLCHRTGSKKKSYVLIRVSPSAVAAHMRHGDKAPTNGSCTAANKVAKAKAKGKGKHHR